VQNFKAEINKLIASPKCQFLKSLIRGEKLEYIPIHILIYITLYLHLGLETEYCVYDVWNFTVL